MSERRVMKVERLSVHEDPAADIWFLPPASRRHPWQEVDMVAVTPPDAPSGWFELERIGGRWRALRETPVPLEHRPGVVPELDLTRPWPRAPRTLRELRAEGQAFINLRCKCREFHVGVGQVCRAFDDWTVDELQRAGHWRCTCGDPPSASVYSWTLGVRARAEHWPAGDGPGWVLF